MHSSDNKKQHESVFEIIDNAMHQLNITKKMFLIMIITAMVLPPLVTVGIALYAEYMGEGDLYGGSNKVKLLSLVEQLENDEISPADYVKETRYVKSSPPVHDGPSPGWYIFWTTIFIYIFWLGFGIRQWFVLTKWSKKYRHSRMVQGKSESKNHESSNSSIDAVNNSSDEMFEVIDKAIHELNNTKRIFLITLIAAIVIPQIILIGFIVIVAEPIQSPAESRFDLILEQLENNEISTQKYLEEFRELQPGYFYGYGFLSPVFYVYVIMLIISIFWLGFGIRQWFVLTRWNKKYRHFKAKDEEIGRKLLGEKR
ncbi:MAG: hypothetical protein ACR2LL_05830 [Nitrosopumilus sp.]